jgi:hypothetical protein
MKCVSFGHFILSDGVRQWDLNHWVCKRTNAVLFEGDCLAGCDTMEFGTVVVFLDIIILFLCKKHNILETEFCLHLLVKEYSIEPI